MRKTSSLIVMTVFLAFHSVAYGEGKTISVNGYIHDIDEANSVLKRDGAAYNAEVARLASTPQAMIKFINTESPITNANKAIATIQTAYEFKKPLSRCFGSNSLAAATTAKTDHACVDAAGFKR